MNNPPTLIFWEYFFTVPATLLEECFRQPEEYRREREGALQEKLLRVTPGGGTEDYVLHRIGHVSAAARAFFEQHRPLTMLSAIPLFEAVEMQLLTAWVHNFQVLEHRVRKAHGHTHPVSLKAWVAPQSYRDELAEIVTTNPVLSQAVTLTGSLPRLMRHPLEEGLIQKVCGQLEEVHRQHHQMK